MRWILRRGGRVPEGGRGGAAEGGRGRAGADFSPVASGLRQFGFLPRLESRRQAFQKSPNRNRAGLHIADSKRGPSSSPSRCRCRSPDLLCFPGKPCSRVLPGESAWSCFSTSDRARRKHGSYHDQPRGIRWASCWTWGCGWARGCAVLCSPLDVEYVYFQVANLKGRREQQMVNCGLLPFIGIFLLNIAFCDFTFQKFPNVHSAL